MRAWMRASSPYTITRVCDPDERREKMIIKVKHSRHIPYTDKEINQYCESVEKLLTKIKEDSITKKRKKIREVEVNEEHITEDENEFALS